MSTFILRHIAINLVQFLLATRKLMSRNRGRTVYSKRMAALPLMPSTSISCLYYNLAHCNAHCRHLHRDFSNFTTRSHLTVQASYLHLEYTCQMAFHISRNTLLPQNRQNSPAIVVPGFHIDATSICERAQAASKKTAASAVSSTIGALCYTRVYQ